MCRSAAINEGHLRDGFTECDVSACHSVIMPWNFCAVSSWSCCTLEVLWIYCFTTHKAVICTTMVPSSTSSVTSAWTVLNTLVILSNCSVIVGGVSGRQRSRFFSRMKAPRPTKPGQCAKLQASSAST